MNNNLYDKAYDFAVSVIKAYQKITIQRKEYTLMKQFLRSGTSIGSNISEANGSFSKADFAYKMSLSYKECLETKYWLNLLKDTGYITEDEFTILFEQADELARILYTIIKKTRYRNNHVSNS